jgi:hypothetical protein
MLGKEKKMATPNVTLLLEGMILLFFENWDVIGGEATATSCQVGILRDAPGHIFEIEVLKKAQSPGKSPEKTVYEEEDIRFTLALKVDNSTDTPIDFKDWDVAFNRLSNTASPESFNWVLDLEREVYPDKRDGIGANRNQFRSVLQLDTGTFYTAGDEVGSSGHNGISLNDLLTCDEDSSPKKIIGKVATRVGVRITLEGANKATFYNSKEVLFEAGADDEYVVSINRTRPHDMEAVMSQAMGEAPAALHHDRDANNFYNAIGQELAPTEKVFFVSTTPGNLPPAGPEAACLVAMMSRSDI